MITKTKRKVTHGIKMYLCDRRRWRTAAEFTLMAITLMLIVYMFGESGNPTMEEIERNIANDKRKLLHINKHIQTILTQDVAKGYEEPSTTIPPELWVEHPQQPRVVMLNQDEHTTRSPDSNGDSLLKLLNPHLLLKPNVSKTYNDLWHIVDDPHTEVYVFSAWYDKRKGLPQGASYVRVITIREANANDLYCVMWYDDADGDGDAAGHATVIKADIKKIGQYYQRGEHQFDQSLLSCPIPPEKQMPANISIITATWQQPSILLPVQEPLEPDLAISFGVCMSVTYWDVDPYRIVEWMELMKLLGIQEVTMYNSSISEEAMTVLDYYVKEEFLDMRSMPVSMDYPGEETILLNMSPSLNDCMYRNMYRYDRIVVVDLDEAIIPRNFTDIIDMFDAIEEDIEEPKKMPIASLVFRNAYFFLDIGRTSNEPWFLLMEKYTRRVDMSAIGYAVKSITNPRYCIGLQNHVCWVGHPQAALYVHVPIGYGVNHHYKKCHFDKYLNKPGYCKNLTMAYTEDTTVMKYRDELATTTAEVLFKMDLIDLFPEDDGAEVIPASAVVIDGVALLKSELFENQTLADSSGTNTTQAKP